MSGRRETVASEHPSKHKVRWEELLDSRALKREHERSTRKEMKDLFVTTSLPSKVMNGVYAASAMLATEEQALEPGGGALLNYENSEWQITVPENGYLKLLAHSFGKTHVVCLAYLYVVTTEFTFRFVSPKSLAMFVDQVAKRLYFKGSPGVMMPTFRIVLDIFHPQAFPQGNEMEEWSHSDFFHGVLYGAQTHFMAWMRAVKRLRELPVKFKTEVHLLCPFRDYLTLSNQSGVLRAENIELNVSVEPETWAKVPERNFNMALTKFALTGKKMDDKWEQKRQNLSIKRISQLSRYGTVGVNRLRVKVPSQE